MLNHITMFQPSAIDNALSTMQIIHKLISKINDIVDIVNNIDSKANEYTDKQIRILIDKIENELLSLEITLKSYSDDSIKNLKTYVDKKDEDIKILIDNKVSEIYNDINKLEVSLKLYIDTEDSNIKVYINEIYEELYNIIMNGNNIIYSPIDGFKKSVYDTFVDIVNIIQHKNGIDWDTLENLCNGDSVDMTGYTKPNDDYDIWLKYEKPQYAYTDYLDANGLHIICHNAISSILIDGQPFTFFNGAGVLFPLGNFDSNETIIVITDVNNQITTISVKNTDYSNSSVTWDSLESKLNETTNNRYFNWNALSFYTVEFANNNLKATDGKMKSVLLETMYTSEFNRNFFGGN